MKKSVEPRWNQTFMYSPVHQREFKDRLLELTVWDQARVREEESQFLGEVGAWAPHTAVAIVSRAVAERQEVTLGPSAGSGGTGLGSAGRPASLVQAAAPRRLLAASAQRLPLPAEEGTAA